MGMTITRLPAHLSPPENVPCTYLYSVCIGEGWMQEGGSSLCTQTCVWILTPSHPRFLSIVQVSCSQEPQTCYNVNFFQLAWRQCHLVCRLSGRITLAHGEAFRLWNSKKVRLSFALPNNGCVTQERTANLSGPQSHSVFHVRVRGWRSNSWCCGGNQATHFMANTELCVWHIYAQNPSLLLLAH